MITKHAQNYVHGAQNLGVYVLCIHNLPKHVSLNFLVDMDMYISHHFSSIQQ